MLEIIHDKRDMLRRTPSTWTHAEVNSALRAIFATERAKLAEENAAEGVPKVPRQPAGGCV